MRVEVLLSTYDGERWLADQLDSVLGQTHSDLVVRVRDDGSTDGTRELLAAYAARDPRLTWREGRNVGAVRSFLQLLSTATGDVVAFCDQDDVWDFDPPGLRQSYVRQAAELRRLHAHRLSEPGRKELDALLDPDAAARVRYALVGGAHRGRTASARTVRSGCRRHGS